MTNQRSNKIPNVLRNALKMDLISTHHPPHFINRSSCQTRKEHRKLVKREKRRKKRQQAAKAREDEEEKTGSELTPNHQQQLEEREEQLEYLREQERKRQHELWLEREREAQEEFKRKKEKEEMLKKKEEEERKRIQAEWEEQQKKEQEKLKKEKAKKDEKQQQLENAIGRTILRLTTTVDDIGVLQYLDKEKQDREGPWRNPDAPSVPADSRKSEICSFFAKTGVCRFGQRCSRSHPDPGTTNTVLLKSMYSNFAMEQSFRDEFDTDISLEYDQETAYQDFLEFYSDVLPEFEKIGKVLILKVCCNWEQHLRGNVYVQFAREEDSSKAVEMFNGRYYAGKSLSCEFVSVNDWRAAICGLFPFGRCPKGKNCNYLHTFTNPDNRTSPSFQRQRRSESASYRSSAWQDRRHRRREYSARSWRHREGSSWKQWSPSKSRSRSRRHSRERRRSYSRSRSRSPSRRTSKRRNTSHSKSRSRSRSRSRSNERNSSESRSPSSDRSHSRSKSRGRSKHHDHNGNGKELKERTSKSERRKKTKRRSHSRRKSVSPKEDSIKGKRSRSKKSVKKSEEDVISKQVEDELSGDNRNDLNESKKVNSGSDFSDGHEAEVEDSDSSAEENAKLEIVEKEIARLRKRADEKGIQSPGETEG